MVLGELEEPTEAELLGLCPDPFAGPPDGEVAWLGDLSVPQLDALADQHAAGLGRGPARAAVGAGFGRDPAAGFAAGGPLDRLEPGQVLTGFVGDIFDQGLSVLSDDELACLSPRLDPGKAIRQGAHQFIQLPAGQRGLLMITRRLPQHAPICPIGPGVAGHSL
jgi:hypothetical protein